MSNKKFTVDVIYTFAGQICIMLVLFGMNKYLSMTFQPELYTIYNIAYKSSVVLAMAALFCLGIAVPRYIALYMAQGNKERSAALVQTAFFMMMALICLLIGFYTFLPVKWGHLIFNTSGYDPLLGGIIIYGIGLAMITFLINIYRGIEDYKKYNSSQIIMQLFTFGIALSCSHDISRMMMIWGIGLSVFAIIGLEVIYKRAYRRSIYNIFAEKFSGISDNIVELVKFCLPRVPGEIILLSLTVVPLIILNEKIGTMATGGFVVAQIINGAVTPLYGLTGTVLLPYVSRLLGETGSVVSASSKINKLMLIYGVSSLLIIAGVTLFADAVLWILFDSTYIVYEYQVRLLIITVLPNSIYLLLRNPLDAASVVPFNTINLIVAFGILIGFLELGQTSTEYIMGFIAAYAYLGISSWGCWLYCKNRVSLQNG